MLRCAGRQALQGKSEVLRALAMIDPEWLTFSTAASQEASHAAAACLTLTSDSTTRCGMSADMLSCAGRQALQGESEVLCALAKIDPEGLTFSAAASQEASHAAAASNGATPEPQRDAIVLVVADGLQVSLPLAGEHATRYKRMHHVRQL